MRQFRFVSRACAIDVNLSSVAVFVAATAAYIAGREREAGEFISHSQPDAIRAPATISSHATELSDVRATEGAAVAMI